MKRQQIIEDIKSKVEHEQKMKANEKRVLLDLLNEATQGKDITISLPDNNIKTREQIIEILKRAKPFDLQFHTVDMYEDIIEGYVTEILSLLPDNNEVGEIFKMGNLSDFEKLLFANKQIEEMKASMKEVNIRIGEVLSENEELKARLKEEKPNNHKLHKYKQQIKDTREKHRKLKIEYERLIEKTVSFSPPPDSDKTGEWISVDKCLPNLCDIEDSFSGLPYSQIVEVLFEDKSKCEAFYDFTERRWLDKEWEITLNKVTHWKHIEPPKTK